MMATNANTDWSATVDVLVDGAYAVTEQPNLYDEFMATWEHYVDTCISNDHATPLATAHNHFKRAMQILDRVDEMQQSGQDAAQVLQGIPGFAVVVDASTKIIAKNRFAQDVIENTRFSDLPLDSAALAQIRAFVDSNERTLFTQTRFNGAPRTTCVLTSRLADWPKPTYLIASVDLHLDPQVLSRLSAAYGLTGAEIEVAAQLANGQNPAEIAADRGASINTVRTQVKRLLKKTHARGIPDLVRMLCGFAANFGAELARQDASTDASSRWCSCTLSDGRRMSYLEQGDPNGTPVLFIHNMLYGVSWVTASVEAATQKGLRIIAPSRPGFGESSRNPHDIGEQLVNQTCDDIAALIDMLALPQVLVVGHAAGSIYAQRFAVRFKHRVRGLLFVSHVPVWRESFLAGLPRRQRVIARTTRYAPSALPFVTRIGAALIESGRENQFIDALHQDIKADMRALRRPDVFDAVTTGLRHTVRNGSFGFVADCPLVLQDWSHDAEQLNVPVRVLHGQDDKVVNQQYIEAYLQHKPDTTVTLVEEAGQFLLFSHWPMVLDALQQLHEQTRTQ